MGHDTTGTYPLGHSVLYDTRYADVADQARQVLIADFDIQYAYGVRMNDFWSFGFGPHASEFWWHFNPSSRSWGGLFYEAPKCNVGFLDGHVKFLRLGPYDDPGDPSTNTDQYILDPSWWR